MGKHEKSNVKIMGEVMLEKERKFLEKKEVYVIFL